MHEIGRDTIEFDPHSTEFANDSVGTLRAVQAQADEARCPVAYAENYGGFWVLSRYKDVTEAARDPAGFSSALRTDGTEGIHIPPTGPRAPRPPLELDPPDFVPYRRLAEPTLSPRAIAAMEAGIGEYVEFFLDLVIEDGRMELMKAFATPLPTTVTLDWLGLDPEQWRLYSGTYELVNFALPNSPELAEGQKAMAELTELVRGELAERRERPRGDVLTLLATSLIDGEPIPERLALGMTMLILAGGVATTADLLAHSLIYLDEHRDVHAALLEDDQFMRTATEELLRRATPVTTIGRVATDKCAFASQAFEPGDSVLLGWIAANHDPEVFDRPDDTDLTRWPNRHLSFGLGPHRCIGSNLARTMFRIGLRAILERMPDFRVVSADVPPDRCTHNAFTRVDIEFTPGPRSRHAGPRPRPQFQDWGALYGTRRAA